MIEKAISVPGTRQYAARDLRSRDLIVPLFIK
jgi:hypothetical protein